MFYLVSNNKKQRSELIELLKKNGIWAVFHYLILHKSPYYFAIHDGRELLESDRYSDCLVRLPVFYKLKEKNINAITEFIIESNIK